MLLMSNLRFLSRYKLLFELYNLVLLLETLYLDLIKDKFDMKRRMSLI